MTDTRSPLKLAAGAVNADDFAIHIKYRAAAVARLSRHIMGQDIASYDVCRRIGTPDFAQSGLTFDGDVFGKHLQFGILIQLAFCRQQKFLAMPRDQMTLAEYRPRDVLRMADHKPGGCVR